MQVVLTVEQARRICDILTAILVDETQAIRFAVPVSRCADLAIRMTEEIEATLQAP